MTVFKRILFWSAIGLLTLLGLSMTLVFNAYLISGCACFCLIGLIFFFLALRRLRPRFPRLTRALRWSVSILLCLALMAGAVTAGFVLSHAYSQPEPGQPYLIVLGCGVNGDAPSISLRERIQAAYTYLTQNPDTVCVVSGGQGNGENISEAACMFRELTKMGIDPDRIWLEDQATSTMENFVFSRQLILEKTGQVPEKIAIASSEYHLFRAHLVAQSLGMESTGVSAVTGSFTLRMNYILREVGAIWAYRLFLL